MADTILIQLSKGTTGEVLSLASPSSTGCRLIFEAKCYRTEVPASTWKLAHHLAAITPMRHVCGRIIAENGIAGTEQHVATPGGSFDLLRCEELIVPKCDICLPPAELTIASHHTVLVHYGVLPPWAPFAVLRYQRRICRAFLYWRYDQPPFGRTTEEDCDSVSFGSWGVIQRNFGNPAAMV